MATELLVDGLHHSYGEVAALDGISLTVSRGAVEALLGPNGAGKTTLIKIVTTLLVPDAGRVEVAGLDVRQYPAAVRQRVALSGQHVALDMDAPGVVNLRTFGRLLGFGRAERARRCAELIEAFGLGDIASRPVATYSGGERRRLDLAVAMLRKPSVLLLDEPTAGLDPYHRRALWQLIEELAGEGVAVLLTTQYLEEADHLADHVTIIDCGRVIAAGRPAALKASTGGVVLTLDFPDVEAAGEASKVLTASGKEAMQQADRVTVPIAEGGEDVPELLHDLYRAGHRPTGLQLREPTLDDAFLLLTDRTAGRRGSEHVLSARVQK